MNSTVRSAVRYTLASCALSALAVPTAFAQTAAQASSQQSQDQSASSTAQLGTVEVTGTRIKRTSVETAQPITVITSQQIAASGLTTIGDLLQNITSAGSSFNLTSQQLSIGSGSQTINLRYFGSDRVLVLVNGRRWTTGLDGTVDLSAIPSAIIDHIEILQDGASAIYGSDAITGVVNLITIQSFNGADAHAYMGMYDNSYGGVSGWDGKKQQYDFTIGTSGDRSGVVMSLSYTDTQPVYAGDRAQTSQPVWNNGFGLRPVTKNSLGETAIFSPALANQKFGNAQCSSSGSCDMMLQNVPSSNPSLDNFTDFKQTINTYDGNRNQGIFSAAQEVTNIFLNAHYNIADSLTFKAMAQHSQMHGQQWIGTDGLGFGASPYYVADNMNLGVGKNNPYNPFGVDLVGNSSQFCPSGQAADGSACTPNYMLNFLGFDPLPTQRHYDSRVGTTTVRMALDGFFNALGSEWDWEAGYSFGNVIDDEDGEGMFDDRRLAQQLDAPGFQQCNGPAQSTPGTTGTWQQINGKYYQILVPGCVPLNPFGGFNGYTNQGSLTPDMLDYSGVTELWQNRLTQRDYTANISGSLVDLPAGPLSLAAGLEYLQENGVEQPGPLISQGNVADVQFQLTQGRTWTHAEYVEFNIPLLANLPMARNLSLDIANRWSQFSWLGGIQGTLLAGQKQFANATTGQAKLLWNVNTDLLFRASWAQGFRAPSVSDLYAGSGFAFTNMQDPCAPANEGGGWDPSKPLPQGCNGNPRTQRSDQIRVALGGNPGLRPENAVSRSLGFVYSPDWLPGFNFSADYYKIEIDNTIGTAGSQFVLNQCYVEQDPTYCAKVTVSGGAITLVNNSNLNVGAEYSNGIDVNTGYTFPTSSIGSFKVNASWTFLRSFVEVEPSASSSTGFVAIQHQGFSGFPTSKGSVGLNWNLGDWSADWHIQYIGQQYRSCSQLTINQDRCTEPTAMYEPNGTTGKDHLGTTLYHDASVTYHIAPVNTDFTFGIRNLFNKQYPFGGNFGLGYRIPGRFVYARVGVKF